MADFFGAHLGSLRGDISFADLQRYFPEKYVPHLETLLAESSLSEEGKYQLVIGGKATNRVGNYEAANELLMDITRPFYSVPHNGLLVGVELQLYGECYKTFMVTAGPAVVGDEGGHGIAVSQHDHCRLFVHITKDGLKFGVPRIFGVLSDYEEWSRYYGDPAHGVEGKFPEKRKPHAQYILDMVELVAGRDPSMTMAAFLEAKTAAYDNVFKKKMPGIVGPHHRLREIVAKVGGKKPPKAGLT